MSYKNKITSPCLLLDEDKCKANIRKIAEKAKRNGMVFRPHFKTHVSLEIGQWFRGEGVEKITVSSLEMAEYFADEWKDITVAFPINILEIDRINFLAEKINLNIVIENHEAVTFLSEHLSSSVNAFIKIDAGNGRTGISFNDKTKIQHLIYELDECHLIHFDGFLCHAGNSYQARGKDEILSIHENYRKKLNELRSHFIEEYPDLKISVGDTPTCSQAEDFTWADEIRPGNFVFYDVMQWIIGSNLLDDIAVVMACPIVAKHKERNELVIHGGAIHFARDSRVHPFLDKVIFGLVVELSENGWSHPNHKDYYARMSQEHGVLHLSDETIDKYNVGDVIGVLPIHSCMTANLMKAYMTLNGKEISRM